MQVILSILSGIFLHWTSVFTLPKAVLQRIDSMLSSFPWYGEIKSHYGAKVKWEDVCKPKTNGGLGVQSIANWNKCLILKFIWNICQKNDTFWVRWIHFVMLKGHSLWEVKISSDCSWCWRKLLHLRHLAQPWIKIDIGNGKSTFSCFDNWHALGLLYLRYPESLYKNLGLSVNSKISDPVNDRTRS